MLLTNLKRANLTLLAITIVLGIACVTLHFYYVKHPVENTTYVQEISSQMPEGNGANEEEEFTWDEW